MKKSEQNVFDSVVIGGGITGSCILWDGTLRGLKMLLIEKNDYASGTSQATSKLIHGGLRYLKNFEFGLVRESLCERRSLGIISPHALQTMGFAVPVYNTKDKLMLSAGLSIYDLLSYDRNQGLHSDRTIPKHNYLNRSDTLLKLPQIPSSGLQGSYLYYDYANINPERHTTEFLFSARNLGAQIQNYTELQEIEKLPGKDGFRVKLYDRIKNTYSTVITKTLVNAGGPWADLIEGKLGIHQDKHIVRSKGIHIVVRKIVGDNTVVLKKRDGSHIMFIPWRGKTIIGTTDTVYEGHPDRFSITKQEILNLLDEANFAYGLTDLQESDVDFYYGGMRPLVEDSGDSTTTYNASRKSEIMDHSLDGHPGFFSAMGGKYTTSRSVAEKLVDYLVNFLPGNFKECETQTKPLMGGEFSDFISLCYDLAKNFPKASGEKIETLAHRYGSLAFDVLKSLKNSNDFYLLSGGEKIYSEEIIYISQNEDIKFATDFFFRRSGAGVPGKPSADSLNGIFSILSKSLKWNPQRAKTEMKSVLDRYKF
ncbi:glycerol-3-phosphate dehydrogenase/oxidase [Leptospira sp. GIMC2001]|nr:glycerol-3-phosphate dehydrogenase/oxidase [Leptospira sp. GIMC2001]WCL49700.1 glycerol-3-phosphate dehydrogenase/oxidase [Leptospira sp. GIMC2001]